MKTNLIVFLILAVVATITACVGGDRSPDNGDAIVASTPSQPMSTPQPTLTKISASSTTITSSPKMVTFSLSSAQRTTPEDVLQEVDYGGGGAMVDCTGSFEHPVVEYASWSCSELGVESELGCTYYVYSCGWEHDESVRTTIEFPDDSSVSETQLYDEYGGYFYYKPSLNDPPGLYTFIFEGESGKVQHSFEIGKPTGSRLYRDEDGLILYNFEPGERVRVFAYKRGEAEVALLEAWQEFQIDSSGQLIVQLQTGFEGYIYIVLGDVSGEHKFRGVGSILKPLYLLVEGFAGDLCELYASYPPDYDSSTQVASGTRMEVIGTEIGTSGRWWHVRLSDGMVGWVPDWHVERIPVSSSASAHGGGSQECPGAPPQQISIGGRAWVCTAYDRLVVHSAPRRSSSEVTRLEPSTYVTVVGGPTCTDGWSWWEIRTDSGSVGWVAEGGDNVDQYFICPAE